MRHGSTASRCVAKFGSLRFGSRPSDHPTNGLLDCACAGRSRYSPVGARGAWKPLHKSLHKSTGASSGRSKSFRLAPSPSTPQALQQNPRTVCWKRATVWPWSSGGGASHAAQPCKWDGAARLGPTQAAIHQAQSAPGGPSALGGPPRWGRHSRQPRVGPRRLRCRRWAMPPPGPKSASPLAWWRGVLRATCTSGGRRASQ